MPRLRKPTSKLMRNFVKDRDIFGHKVRFNFNQKAAAHKTIVGGLFSVMFKVLYAWYFSFLIREMVFHRDDRFFNT